MRVWYGRGEGEGLHEALYVSTQCWVQVLWSLHNPCSIPKASWHNLSQTNHRLLIVWQYWNPLHDLDKSIILSFWPVGAAADDRMLPRGLTLDKSKVSEPASSQPTGESGHACRDLSFYRVVRSGRLSATWRREAMKGLRCELEGPKKTVV